MKSDRGRGCRRPRLASAGGRRSDAFQKKQNNNKKDKRKAHEEVNKCRIKSAALKGQCSCVPHRHLQLGLGRGRVRVPGDVDLRDPFGGRWPRPSPERPLRPGGVLHSGDPRLEPVWARAAIGRRRPALEDSPPGPQASVEENGLLGSTRSLHFRPGTFPEPEQRRPSRRMGLFMGSGSKNNSQNIISHPWLSKVKEAWVFFPSGRLEPSPATMTGARFPFCPK